VVQTAEIIVAPTSLGDLCSGWETPGKRQGASFVTSRAGQQKQNEDKKRVVRERQKLRKAKRGESKKEHLTEHKPRHEERGTCTADSKGGKNHGSSFPFKKTPQNSRTRRF
jgi:hypothetical protein